MDNDEEKMVSICMEKSRFKQIYIIKSRKNEQNFKKLFQNIRGSDMINKNSMVNIS
ncbi:MAG: hypothetical protein HFI91_00965 [Lachnospiraceae bacterium]|nr:hypothetical protein [Lachnospiraceae bacterium]